MVPIFPRGLASSSRMTAAADILLACECASQLRARLSAPIMPRISVARADNAPRGSGQRGPRDRAPEGLEEHGDAIRIDLAPRRGLRCRTRLKWVTRQKVWLCQCSSGILKTCSLHVDGAAPLWPGRSDASEPLAMKVVDGRAGKMAAEVRAWIHVLRESAMRVWGVCWWPSALRWRPAAGVAPRRCSDVRVEFCAATFGAVRVPCRRGRHAPRTCSGS